MFQAILSVVSKGGYAGIFLLMFLENVFPPIPSEVIMPLGGFLAEQGKLNFWIVVLLGTLGSTAGQLVLYYVGEAVGEERLKRWADEHGHWMAVSVDEIERSKAWFDRHGGTAVLICRMVPALRSLISLPAGIVKMPILAFLGYTVIGSGLWTAALAHAGRLLGQNYEVVEQYLNPATYAILGILLGTYLFRVFRRYRKDS